MKNKMLSFFKITFVLSTILLISSSCTKDKWYNDTYVETTRVDINQSQWKWNSDTKTYYVELSYPLINDFLLNNGTVNVVVTTNSSNIPLPYTSYYYVNNIELSQTVSFEYGREYIRFVISALDDFTAGYTPESFTFYVTTISQAVN